MTDLEMTKLCAEAMDTEIHGLPLDDTSGVACYKDPGMKSKSMQYFIYDPLHDDAQAMALVKKFRLSVGPNAQMPEDWWSARTNEAPISEYQCADAIDLNRAIVECVAKMEASANDSN